MSRRLATPEPSGIARRILNQKFWFSILRALRNLLQVTFSKSFAKDIHGIQHEVVPLCVLDFYVHTTQQRHGFGKKLFEHILMVNILYKM